MTLDPSIDLGVEILDEGPDNPETILTSWLAPLLPIGQVSNGRLSGDPLPFIEVSYVDGDQKLEESSFDDVVSVHCLYARGKGNANKSAAGQFASIVDRRVLLLGRYLEPVIIGDRTADLDFVRVFSSMRWEPYGDDQILRKVARYRIGGTYAKLS